MVKSKIFIFMGVICCMCLLSACFSFRARELGKTGQELEILDEQAHVILKALEGNDFALLSPVLSGKALETEDLQEGFDYSCKLLETEQVVELEQGGCPISSHYGAGNSYKKSNASYRVKTESGRTLNLYFEYWYSHESDKTVLGVNRIKLYDLDTIDENFKAGRLYERAGIYNPNWDSE